MRQIVSCLFAAMLSLFAAAPAFAQVCSPVPALPDTERRTQYSISSQTGPFSVGFAIYGDSTDYQDWVQVYLNGALLGPSAYALTSPTTTLATGCRPITDAQVTLTTASTGTLQIVGAQRPRRLSQFAENRGVAARDLNQVLSAVFGELREAWDFRNRVIQGVPGDVFTPLPAAALRAGTMLGFDGAGALTLLPLGSTVSLTAGSTFNTRGLAAAATISGTVQFLQTAGYTTVGDGGAALYARAGGTTPCGFQSADGTWWSLATTTNITLKQCGAIGNGVADDTTATQNWVSACIANGVNCYCPAGTYLISSTVTITNVINMGGVNMISCLFKPSALSVAVFLVQTVQPVYLHDFSIQYASLSNAGVAAVKIDCPNGVGGCVGTTSVNNTARVERLFITNSSIGIQLVNAAYAILRDNFVGGACGHAFDINAPNVAVGGDNLITGNTVACTGAEVGLFLTAGSGVRFIGNKVVGDNTGVGSVGVQLALEVGAPGGVSDLMVADNSIENVKYGVLMSRLGTTGSFINVTIQNNQFETSPGGVSIDNPPDANGAWLSNVVVTGNVTLGPAVTGYTGVELDATIGCTVGHNQIKGGGAVSVGVSLGSNTSSCLVDSNNLIGMTVAVADTSTGAVFTNNLGFNPVGPNAAVSVCASPCTITAGISPETHYLRQTATNTATVSQGGVVVSALANPASYYQVMLAPHESMVVTWSTTTPTDTKVVH